MFFFLSKYKLPKEPIHIVFMPSGATHDRLTLWIFPWVVICGWSFTQDGELVLILSSSFLFSGLMFGPDLDIYSVQFKRWGGLRFIWVPYQKLVKHRSILSHGPIIGTCVRLIYLLGIFLLVGILLVGLIQLFWDFDWNWYEFRQKINFLTLKKHRNLTLGCFLGLELGSLVHILSDWFASRRKRSRKKPQRRQSQRKKRR